MKLTSLNAWVLRKLFAKANEIPNRINPSDAPHLRRLVKMGYVVVKDRETLALTDSGLAVVGR